MSWSASPSSNVNQYVASWVYNGAVQPPVIVPATAAQDISGYTLDLATSVPSIKLQGGDTLTGSVVVVDTVDDLSSLPTQGNTVTVPTVPTAPLPVASVIISVA